MLRDLSVDGVGLMLVSVYIVRLEHKIYTSTDFEMGVMMMI